ncbi:hypothetical protein NCAS_0H03460 [Naumovozyma castellii]|uniref:DUF1748-domain-containing protein n=1 Tax=Naumovozyma castellii TaxID=27288 RepID=G0VJH7_NAUCA|nr:hypothetical protein NCAS_0H03460 [Naumovozyma castellii CBS 4309]CCC71656.1 hypothetical protein NCAS_0H03460 [Naumovozyma castellii CBS 4309]
MGLSSIVHYGVDATLIAMLLAAVRHNTGKVFAYETYDFSSILHGYMNWGEYCYNWLLGYVKNSKRFRREIEADGFSNDVVLDYKRDDPPRSERSRISILPRN